MDCDRRQRTELFPRKGGGKFTNPETGNEYIPFNNIQCIDINGNSLWAGTFSKGIYVLDLDTFRTVHYEKSSAQYSLDNNDIFAICTDSDGTTWIGTSSGAAIFLPEKDGFRKFEKTGVSFISDIAEDSQGYIWFATFNSGVFRYDKEKDHIQNFRHSPDNPNSLCYNRITTIFEDSRHRLWFGSEDGGFCRFDRIDETFTTVSAADGLPSNVIHKIIEDNDGYLWLSTNNGIVRFNPDGMRICDVYNYSNGLPSRQFNYNSGYKEKDGTIYFGSINGFVYFNPEDIRHDTEKHNVVITGFNILDYDGENTVIRPPYTSAIGLDHKQTSFSVSFSALDYRWQGNGKYAYMLEGAEKTWNYIPDKVSAISYNRIKPGNYTLMIKYSPDGHTWDGTATSLQISITPPFWKTGWAQALLIILLLLSAAGIIVYIMHRKEKSFHNELYRQEQIKKEEIYKAKIDFFTNIAHEIRTPITLIKIPLDHILNNNLRKEELRENLITMDRNANRLLVLVNQLLDFRKVESNAMTLSLKEKDINEILADTFSRFYPIARQNGIDMTIGLPEQHIIAAVDEDSLIKICSNLFNNAIKYARSYVKVSLSRNEEYGYFQIVVRNDGEKIPVNMHDRIFEAFFQIKDVNFPSRPGSGIGLTLASSLTKMHNGSLFIDGNAEDTAFVVQIPTGLHAEKDERQHEHEKNVTEETVTFREATGEKHEYTLLVVEDNEELLNLLGQQLEMQYNVITATNGIEAIKVLENTTVHLIVSDVMMPLMDGIELCIKVKSSLSTSHIPVILLTAKTNLTDKISGLENGADAYIGKPFSISYLFAQIDNLLKSRAALMKKFAESPLLGTDIMAHNKADEEFLQKLTNIIMQNLSNDTFDVDMLAQEMCMSRSSLHRKIRGVTKMTPGGLILVLRLKKAAELLLNGGYRINEVCMLVGINSMSYFSKSFHRQFGVLPKDYARSVREKNSD